MKALILVGGQGTRLRPLTVNTPKAMMPVLNRPFLEYVIRRLAGYGIREIILTQGHLSQPIEGYFGDGGQFGVSLSYVVENSPLGTAGAVKNAEKHLGDRFLVLNGDVFTDLDLAAMIRFHRERKAVATISLTPVEDPTRYGLIETDPSGRVSRFLEKPSPDQITTDMINAGTYVLERRVLDGVPPQTQWSFERQLFPSLLESGQRVFAYPSPAYWMDIGHPKDYFQLNIDLLKGKSSQHIPARPDEVSLGEGSQVDETARLTGPALIGRNCRIGRRVKMTGPTVTGDNCCLEEGAVIEESIIWHDTRIGAGARVVKSIIGEGCHIEAGSVVNDAVLGDNVTVVGGHRLKAGSRIWPGKTVGGEDKGDDTA
jgi:mannose-1-phosphate guanylyltransferase